MVTLFHMALVGIFILIIMGIVSNTNQTAFTTVENEIFLMNCPYPINGGRANNTNIVGLTVNYTLWRDTSNGDYHLTLFDCVIDPLSAPPHRGVSVTVLTTANNWFNVAGSYLAYTMNGIFAVASQIQHLLVLFSFILTPANFAILGYTLDDLSGSALMVVVSVYIFAYTMIGSWLFITFNPFKGSG